MKLVKPEMALINQDATSIRNMIDIFEVLDDLTQEEAMGALRNVKERIKELEEQRLFIVTPFKEHCADIDTLYRTPRRELEEAERLLKDKIGYYQLSRKLEVDAALQDAKVKHLEGAHTEAAAAIVSASGAEPSKLQGSFTRHYWTAQVVTPGKVPRNWCDPSAGRLNEYAKGVPITQDPEPVPGVEFVRKSQVTVRK